MWNYMHFFKWVNFGNHFSPNVRFPEYVTNLLLFSFQNSLRFFFIWLKNMHFILFLPKLSPKTWMNIDENYKFENSVKLWVLEILGSWEVDSFLRKMEYLFTSKSQIILIPDVSKLWILNFLGFSKCLGWSGYIYLSKYLPSYDHLKYTGTFTL